MLILYSLKVKSVKDKYMVRRMLYQDKPKGTNPGLGELQTKVKKIKKVGEGTYGKIYHGKVEKSDLDVAVKRNMIEKTEDFMVSLKELDLLASVRGHPFIVYLVDVSIGNPFPETGKGRISPNRRMRLRDDKLFFIFEKAPYDGHTLIYQKDCQMDILKLGMVQTLLGLEYLHGMGIIHRDIKPANILIFDDDDQTNSLNPNICNSPLFLEYYEEFPIFKLCDFGLGKYYTKQGLQSPRTVTNWYRAPEICFKWPDYGPEIDIWSIGCVFYEMISASTFITTKKEDNIDVIRNILSSLPYQVEPHVIKYMVERGDNSKLTEQEQRTLYHGGTTLRYDHFDVPGNKKKTGIKNKISLSCNKHTWREQLISEDGFGPFEENILQGDESSSLEIDQFIDLLNGMLQFSPINRFTVKQCLEHPFFEKYRPYIEAVRTRFTPKPSEHRITVVDCIEREWAMKAAFTVFNNRTSYNWYSHRVLFQAVDMFDRYLYYAFNKLGSSIEQKIESEHRGLLHTQTETILCFLVCLYIGVKYFMGMDAPTSFKDVAHKEYHTEEMLLKAEDLELELIKNVFQMRIYRPTIYEEADDRLDEDSIRDLLRLYGTLTDFHGMKPKDLYAVFRSVKDNNTKSLIVLG